MLQVFRDHAHKWFIKVLLSIIVISFGLWGIGDVIYKFFTHRPVVTVGKHSISHEELSHHMQKETARINNLTKGKLTNQQLKSLGLHKSVINRLVSQLVLGEELERMNLGISDEVLKDQIHAMQTFQLEGKFDENKFLSALHDQSMSERTFLKEARNSMLTQQLVTSIAMGARLPAFYTETLIGSLTQEKVFAFVEIDASKMKIDKKPSKEQLESFYEQFKNRYMVPEYRNITVMILDNQAMRHLLGISEDDVRKFYNERKENLRYPERRSIKRLTFKDQERAAKAQKMIEKGASLAKVSKEINGGELEDMGLVAKEQLAEFAADKIFELKSGKATDVIPTGFGFHIFQVSKIEQSRIATFDEAKEELENILVQEQKSSRIDEIRSKIDDSLAAGQNLEAIAKTMNLSVQNIDSINQQGKSANGHPIFKKPNALQQAIIEKAFTTEQGLDSGFVDIAGEGAFVLCVNKVNPANVPAFNDIEEKINKDWETEQKLEEASKLASSIASDAKSMNALVSLATKHNLPLSTNHAFTKLELGKNEHKSKDIFPTQLAEKAFMLAKETATAGQNEKGGFTVVMLQKTHESKATNEEKQNLKTDLNNMIQEDVAASTINAMKELHKIEINQEMLAQMMD